MNDDLQQIREEIFDRIILGLALVGLFGSLATFVVGEFSWTWFLRWMALLVVTLIAFLLRRNSQFAVAAYVLVIELIGVVAGIFLQPGLIIGFTPYLFIPIIVIAGLILSPLATLTMAIFSIFTALGLIAFKGQVTAAQLVRFLPPFALTFITAWLVTEGSRFLNKMGKRLENKETVLREHSTGMSEALDKAEKFQQTLTGLEKELAQAQARVGQKEQIATQRDKRLYNLVQGTVHELEKLEQEFKAILKKIDAIPKLRGQESFFEEAWEKLNYFENILRHIEELARLESRNVAPAYQTVELRDLLRQVVATAQTWLNTKDVKLSYRVMDDLPELQADPDLLQQALLHVLENAAKYTDQGLIEIQADLTEEDEVIIFISDTGIGMYREEMDLIFEKFGRGRGTLAQQRRGGGLGLTISQQLIELHGGRMWVSSVLGVGSTFYMTLPLEPESSKAIAPAASHVAIPMRIPTTATVIAAPTSSHRAAREAALISSELNTKVFPTFPPDERKTTEIEPADETDHTLLDTYTRPKSNFGPPVARFGPTYISRFGLILLGLLLIIAGVVLTLAIFNGPNDPDEAGIREVGPPSKAVTKTLARQTPRLEAVSVLLPTPASFATPTLPPTTTAAMSVQPTATLPSLPPKSLLSTPSPVPTNTPTAVPTEEPSPTPTQSTSVTSNADQGSAVSPADLPVTTRPSGQISFIIDQGQDRSIALQNLDETSEISLVAAPKIANNSRVSWSPSGQLLFSADTSGDPEIYVTQAHGGEPQQLTQAAGDDIQPVWSPDGRRIAFSSGRTGNLNIYVMDADGLNLQQLTTSRGFDEWPVWSPDGRHLAFVSNRDGNVEIYTMNADGSDQQRLTNHPADDLPPAWSPDGSQLVFASWRDSNWNLYLINTDGSHLQRLTNDPANEQDPVWSADGQTIAFTYDGTGNLDIYTISVPTPITEIPRSTWTQITNTPLNEQAPVWLP